MPLALPRLTRALAAGAMPFALAGAGTAAGSTIMSVAGPDTPDALAPGIGTARGQGNGVMTWGTFDSGVRGLSAVISADGTRAYVGDLLLSTIHQFARNPDTGELSPLSPATVSAPSGTWRMAITPGGGHLLATSGDTITRFAIGGDGALTALGQATAPSAIQDILISPDGRSLYATVPDSINGDRIHQWDIGADATLTPKSPASVDAGDAECLAITPDGRSVYVSTSWAMRNPSSPNAAIVRWVPDATTGTITTTSALPPNSGGSASGCGLQVAPNSSYLALSFGVGLQRWQLEPTGAFGASSSQNLQNRFLWFVPRGLGISPDSGTAYVASSDHAPFMGDVLVGMPIMQFAMGGGGPTLLDDVPPGVTNQWFAVAVASARPPIAALPEASGVEGRAITLDASASRDPDTALATYEWAFGDGTTAQTSTPRVEHVYARAGTHTARVTVTNTAGCSTGPGIYTGRAHACTGGPSATATARVRVEAAPAQGGSSGASGVPIRPKPLKSAFAIRGRVGTTSGVVPAGATRVLQTARRSNRTVKATCRIAKRKYTCTIRLAKGTWAVTTTARGPKGIVAQGARRVVVRQ